MTTLTWLVLKILLLGIYDIFNIEDIWTYVIIIIFFEIIVSFLYLLHTWRD